MSEIETEPWTTTKRAGVKWGIIMQSEDAPEWAQGLNPYHTGFAPRLFDSREEAERFADKSSLYHLVIEETYVTKTLRLVEK